MVLPSLPPDPSSKSYRKQLRQHLTSLPPPSPSTSQLTPLRTAEKHFKRRFPPPDLSSALDLALYTSPSLAEHAYHGSLAPPHSPLPNSLNGSAYILPSHPGLVVLPGFLPPEAQREMIRECLEGAGLEGRETSLDAHWDIPPSGIWSLARSSPSTPIPPKWLSTPSATPPEPNPPRRALVSSPPSSVSSIQDLLMPKPPPEPSTQLAATPAHALLRKLRWANLGASYHWGEKTYDLSRSYGEMLPSIKEWAGRVVRAVDWSAVLGDGAEGWDDYEPDAGIINFYQLNSTLMAHVDHSELDATRPLVSISLGHACVFLVGSAQRDDAIPPTALVLRSGDALVLAGPSRRAYHGVPRILEGTLPPYLWDDLPPSEREAWLPFGEYMAEARINVNVREVGLRAG